METCNCDLCRSLDTKRAAAIRWLGSRWLLAPKNQVLREQVIDIQWQVVQEIFVDRPRPQLRLVK